MYTPAAHFLIFGCLSLSSGVANAVEERPVKAPATDLYGDPLPDGAIARFGSARLRHAGLSDFVILPGGETILSAGSDRVLRVWDMATGRQVRAVRLQGTAGPGRCVTLSTDGKTLAAGDGKQLVFWEVDSGKEIKTLPGPKADLNYLYFSPDGKTLALGRGDWRVSLLEWKTGKEREFPLPLKPDSVVQLNAADSTFHGSFSPDGKWFVAGASWQQPLGVFEVATGREVHRLNCFALTSAVSPDSKRLAVCPIQNDNGKRETVIRLFDLSTGKEAAQFPQGDENRYHSLVFSPDGKTLACGRSNQGRLLDCGTGRVLHRFHNQSWIPAFAPDGKTLVFSAGHRLHIWDVGTGKQRQDRPGEFGYLPILAVSPDGRRLASGDWGEQSITVWDTADGRLLHRLPLKGERQYVRSLTFSADGQTIIACQSMGFLQFWDVATGKERRTVQLGDPAAPKSTFSYFHLLHVSPDGKHASALDRVYIPGETGTRLAVWEIATGKPVSQQTFPGELRHAACLADGKAVALPLSDGLALVDLPTGLVRFKIAGVAGSGPLAVSPDGRLLAGRKTTGTGKEGESGAVAVWEIATGKEVAAVTTGRVEHLALAPDDRSLVTTDEKFLRVWDLATGKERRRWPLPVAATDSFGKTFVFALVLSPDGRRAFTALADGTALVWDLAPALRPAEPPVKQAGEKEFAVWWADLARADAGRAYAAAWRIAESPEEAAVAFLRKHLKPAPSPSFKEIRQIIADLDNDAFTIREKAFKRLEEIGNAAVPELRATLEKTPSTEVRLRLEKLLSSPPGLVTSPTTLRRLRAIQVLERIASKEAKGLLDEVARGAGHVAEAQEAKASLERLSRRSANP